MEMQGFAICQNVNKFSRVYLYFAVWNLFGHSVRSQDDEQSLNLSPKKVRIFVTRKCIFSTYTKNAASTVSTWEQVYLKKLKGVHALDSY